MNHLAPFSASSAPLPVRRHRADPDEAMLGGDLRVGREDGPLIGPGELTPSDAPQVRTIRSIVEALGLEIATPAQARERLGRKGADRVGF